MKKIMIFLLVFVFIIIFVLGFYMGKIGKDIDTNYSQDPNDFKNSEDYQKFDDSTLKKSDVIDSSSYTPKSCQGKGIVNLTSSPRPFDQLAFIEPMGLMLGEHVTPIDHQYYVPYNFKQSSELTLDDLKDVLAPADGVITEISRMPDFFAVKNSLFKDYRLTLHYTCDFYSIYIHIYQLAPEIEEQVKDLTPGNTRYINIPVKSGGLIGKANSFDFSLHDENVILPGFIYPEHYNREPWKIHTVDPSNYFIEPVRSKILDKNLRKIEPYGGKIDHDIEGSLSGNWFKENTNFYQGIKEPEYWITHVSFSPDAIDPDYFLVSLGDYEGKARQFGTKTNSPLPRDVSVSSGIIKYELVDYSYIDDNGAYWDRITPVKKLKAVNSISEVRGIVLVQLIEGRKLRLEIFPNKQASEILGFTSKAMIYTR